MNLFKKKKPVNELIDELIEDLHKQIYQMEIMQEEHYRINGILLTSMNNVFMTEMNSKKIALEYLYYIKKNSIDLKKGGE